MAPFRSGEKSTFLVVVRTAVMADVGASTGSLHVATWSPTRAIGFPFTSTVGEPINTRPWLVGGFWNVDGGGAMCGGMFCAMLPCTAACRPFT